MFYLNYLHLHHFFVIAREGQIARAARLLHIGQPTLSTQLKKLEESLGFLLFVRKRGETVRLTDKGETLFKYAKEIFRIGDEMVEVAQGLKTSHASHFRIGALDTLPKRLVFRVMKQAFQVADCAVSVFEDNADQLFEKLADHRYDLVISTAPAPRSESFPTKAKKLKEFPLVVCGSDQYVPLKKGFPESLEGRPLMMPTPDGKLHAEVTEFFHDKGIQPKIIGEAQDAEILRLTALSGIALAPLSYLTIEEDLRLGRLHIIGELTGLREELWISSFPRLVQNPISSKLMKLSHV